MIEYADTEPCAICEAPLKEAPDSRLWVELNSRTGKYEDGGVPAEDSQGWFPIGRDCAKRLALKGRLFSEIEEKPLIVKWVVDTWSSTPERREYERETAQYVFRASGRRDAKRTQYVVMFDTEKEALDAIELRLRQKVDKAMQAVENAESKLRVFHAESRWRAAKE